MSKKQEPKKNWEKISVCFFYLLVLKTSGGTLTMCLYIFAKEAKLLCRGSSVHLLYFWDLGILQERNRCGAPHLQTTPQKKLLQVSAARFSILNKLR